MTDIPQEAVDAAVDAVMADRNLMTEGSRTWATGIVQAALPAAAAILVADALKAAARKQFEVAIADAAEEATTARLHEIEAIVRASERARITGLFDEWIAVCLAEPNHHPVDAWRAGFRSLLDIDHPGTIATTDPALD